MGRVASLLFEYVATVARYDLSYEVRDRARFLTGLLDSSTEIRRRRGQGHATVMLDEEQFKRGVSVEEFTGSEEGDNKDRQGGEDDDDKETSSTTLRTRDVRKILFEGKTYNSIHGEFSLSPLSLCVWGKTLLIPAFLLEKDRSMSCERHELGSFSLVLQKRPFSSSLLSTVPAYPTSVPPSSIRNPVTPSPVSSGSIGGGAMRGFGSESIRSISSNSRGGGGSPRDRHFDPGRRERVVLVPTGPTTSDDDDDVYRGSAAAGFGTTGTRRKKEVKNLDDFYRDDDDDDEEEEDDTGSEEEEEEESSEEEEEEDSSSSEEGGSEGSRHGRPRE